MTARPNALHDGLALVDEASRRLVHIRPRRTGYYVPDEAGVLAAIVPVEDADGGIIDLVAYEPSAPQFWWLRTGLGVVLGADALDRARCYVTPVTTCATPQAWVQEQAWGNLDTVCLLDRSRGKAVLAGVEIAWREVRRAA